MKIMKRLRRGWMPTAVGRRRGVAKEIASVARGNSCQWLLRRIRRILSIDGAEERYVDDMIHLGKRLET